MVQPRVGSVMVVGGGIAGMQTALDLAKRFFANGAWWRLSIRSLQCPLDHEKKSLASIVVACPLCHVNLDARQKQIEEEFKETFQLPILYFTQLMGLAFGLNSEELGLDKHFIDPMPILKKI